MTTETKITRETPEVVLGGMTLPAEDYTLECAVSAVLRGLCDGRQMLSLMGDIPCKLIIAGRVPAENSTGLLAKMQNAMRTHMAFSFWFQESVFEDMVITEMQCSVSKSAGTASYSLVLRGKLRNEVQTA